MVSIGKHWFRKGTNTWVAKLNGKAITLVKGPNDEATEQLARLEHAKLLIKHNALDQEDKRLLPTRQVFESYMVEMKPNPETPDWQRKVVNLNEFLQRYGDTPISQLTDLDIDDYIAEHKSWKPGTRRKRFGQIASVFNSRLVKRICPINPCSTAQRYADGVRGEEFALTAETVQKLLQHADDDERDLIVVLWQSGARPGEIFTATYSEYDPVRSCLDKATWKSDDKQKYRCILLRKEAKQIVEKLAKKYPDGPLFRNSFGRKWKNNSFGKRLDRLKAKAGIKDTVIPYGFRHGAACFWLRNRVPIETVSAWLGHSSIAITQKHYAKLIYLIGGSIDRMNALNDTALASLDNGYSDQTRGQEVKHHANACGDNGSSNPIVSAELALV